MLAIFIWILKCQNYWFSSVLVGQVENISEEKKVKVFKIIKSWS
jgi:hypothetical protein